ncbi:GspH/FimT family pseudopilin [Halorhodospira halochloris]|uniref:Type II secretion system protein H n=1 Tax=Halorhodospira halochloris TaxID=1052 RepID=A0A110B5F2_HALHR|nr:GspH/FimT family pseudopilin [Halorhodospira halochloris]MBK1651396.1 hypothetical protein [Halorhodospira halochloris]MCG5531174.1 GspH/FimT family pseudopilin [Halorhodospira halochloris]BAU57683.1 type IV fimbrial biogenesis protein FimT [Halorhodospira halochloris]
MGLVDRGFTLPELMMVIAIIGLLIALAAPQWSATRSELSAWMWQRELSGGLERARAHSISYAAPVSLCGGTPTHGCSAEQWSSGWIAFEDPQAERSCSGVDSSGNCEGHGGKVLEIGRGVTDNLEVSGNHNVRHGVHYSPDNWGVAPGTFKVCRGEQHLGSIIISRSGRVRRAAGNDEGC